MAYLGSEIRSRIDSLKVKVNRGHSTVKSRQTTFASSFHRRKQSANLDSYKEMPLPNKAPMSVHNYGSGKIGGGYAQRKRYEGLGVPNILRYERVNRDGQIFMQ